MLEKSRVVKVAAKERGYHIFYFMLRGAPDALLKKLYLTDDSGKRMTWEGCNYLKTGGDLTVKHDEDGWNELVATINNLKFTEEYVDYIWRSVAAVLLLGQVEFDPVSFKDVETKSTPGNI